MPRIPTVQSSESPIAEPRRLIGTRTNAQAEGAGVARALGGLGQATSNAIHNTVRDGQRRKKQEAVAAKQHAAEQARAQAKLDKERAAQVKLNVANRSAQFDFTPRELELQNEVPETADGYRDLVRKDFTNNVEDYVSSIPDNDERVALRAELMKKLPELSARATKHEFKTRSAYNQEQANVSVSSLTNRARLGFEDTTALIQHGNDVIDASTSYSQATKAGMKTQNEYTVWNAEFDGRVERASTPEEMQALQEELTGEGSSYYDRLLPADMDRLSGAIETKNKSITAGFKAEARSAIATLTERSGDVSSYIPAEEITAASAIVNKSGDATLMAKIQRISRDEHIKRNYGKMPVPDMKRDMTGAANRYPGVNPTLAPSIAAATKFDGVSEEYIARFVSSAYPQRAAAEEQAEFKPIPSTRRVNMKGVDADVKDALMVAGQLIGEPLVVTDGKRLLNDTARHSFNLDYNKPDVVKHGHGKQGRGSLHNTGRGVDLRIRDKSPEQQASMVAALVDAGFTGIGVYDDHIHADFRDKVPNTFGKQEDGTPWGGWTTLTPQVQAELESRGFKPGAKASDITRSSKVSSFTDADMRTASAEILPDEKIEGMLTALGKDFNGDTVKELRSDPDALIKLVAMNASLNGKAIQEVTGQPAAPEQLAMVDELGLPTAVALMRAKDIDPSAPLAEVAPEVAAQFPQMANQSVGSAYNDYAGQFVTEGSAITYGDQKTKRKIMERVEKGLKEDPVTLAMQMQMTDISPLEGAAGFAARGEDMRYIAELHGKNPRDLKPFAEQEMRDLEHTIGEGTAQEVLELVSSVQSMGDEVAQAATKQIGEIEPTVAYAAELHRATGNSAVASAVVRGTHRLRDNPGVKATLGMTDAQASISFDSATKGALSLIDPEQKQSMLDAAFAYAVETRAMSGSTKKLTDSDLEAGLDAVLGGGVLQKVNGNVTILPPKVTSKMYEKAASRMTHEDYTLMSRDKKAPSYGDGNVISLDDLEDEARLMPIGGGQYNLLMDDGSFVVSQGTLDPFVYEPDAGYIEEIASRSRGRRGRDVSETTFDIKYGTK